MFLSAFSIALFGAIGLPYFYFLGAISGFLSLIPYLGVLLAILPPLIADLGHLTTGVALLIIAVVLGLHLIAMNVLYPKILGKRLQLNPLAVTLALLFWGPGGEWGLIKSHKLDGAAVPHGYSGSRFAVSSGVVVVVTVNDRIADKAHIWVQKEDKTLGFSPY